MNCLKCKSKSKLVLIGLTDDGRYTKLRCNLCGEETKYVKLTIDQ